MSDDDDPPTDKPGDLAILVDGAPLAGGVRARALHDLDEGDIVAIVLRSPAGVYSLQQFEAPTRAMLEALLELARGYRRYLAGH